MISGTGNRCYPGEGTIISLFDVGWGLARTGRFAGQTKIWYPVLPHVYVVAKLVPSEFVLEALLHDAAEAVLGDVVATWKNDWTKSDESELLRLLYEEHGLTDRPEYAEVDGVKMSEQVLVADLAARSAEAKLLGHSTPDGHFFEEIRVANPELYKRALVYTEQMIHNFSPEYWIIETEKVAKDYAQSVNNQIQKVLA